MKVAIVHEYITKVGGAQNVLKVLHEIFPDAPIYTLLYDEKGTRAEFKNGYNIITSSLQKKPGFIKKRVKLLLNSYAKAIEEFDFTEFDVVISSSNSFAHGILTRPNTLHISYCYSPMRYVWDWHHEYLIENNISSGPLSIIIRKILSNIRIWDFLAAKRVDTWVAISQTVANRISKFYRMPSHIIYPPADLKGLDTSDIKSGDYYLVLSHLTPYKKIDLVVSAFNKNGQKLIIAGEGPDRTRLESLATSENIEFTGFVDRPKMIELYKNCKAFIFPGEEDFGLTAIEAMACGKPVLALNKGGVAESVINGKTGFFFDQPTAESLNEVIRKFERNLSAISAADCSKRAHEFSKEVFKNNFAQLAQKEYKRFIQDANIKK